MESTLSSFAMLWPFSEIKFNNDAARTRKTNKTGPEVCRLGKDNQPKSMGHRRKRSRKCIHKMVFCQCVCVCVCETLLEGKYQIDWMADDDEEDDDDEKQDDVINKRR